MVSRIVRTILNRTLNSFIENLKSDQLDISIFSGTVKLENLSLKKTVLDNVPFPFRLEYGYVGKIFVDIPIRNLSSRPVKVEISDVFVLLRQVGPYP